MDIKALLYEAHCCKEAGQILAKDAKLLSSQLLKFSMKKFCQRSTDFPESVIGSKAWSSLEAIIIAVNIGCTDELPMNMCHDLELFRCVVAKIPFLSNPIERLKVMEFIFIQSNVPQSGILLQFPIPLNSPLNLSWLIKHNICSAHLCEQLLRNGLKMGKSLSQADLLKSLDDETCSIILNYTSKEKSYTPLVNAAIRNKKARATCTLIKKFSLSGRDSLRNTLKGVFRNFNSDLLQIFSAKCNPMLRGELLNVILFSPEENEKKFQAINIVTSNVQSGHIQVDLLDLREMFRNQHCLSFFLMYPAALKKLLSVGLKIGSHEKELAVLLFRNKDTARVVQVVSILLEHGANVSMLKAAYTGRGEGSAILGATELAVKTGNPNMLKMILEKTGRDPDECQRLMKSFDKNKHKPLSKSVEVVHRPNSQIPPHQTTKKRDNQSDKSTGIQDEVIKQLNVEVDRLLKKELDYFVPVQEDENQKVSKLSDDENSDDEGGTKGAIHPAVAVAAAAANVPSPTANAQHDIDDTEIFADLEWAIFISKQVADFLKDKKRSRKVIKHVRQKLYRLGQGERGKTLCHRCIEQEDNLYETHLYRESRIIWHETIQYSEKLSSDQREVYTDVIRVLWITTTHTTTQLNDVLQKIKSALAKSKNSIAYKNLQEYGSHQQVGNEKNLKHPRQFTTSQQLHVTENKNETYRPFPNIFGGEYSLMQFHPFHEFLDAYLSNDSSNYETSICMSPQEQEIVKLGYKTEPIILCGRSGTGKTTTCIYRMWNEYRIFWECFSRKSESPQDSPQAEIADIKLCHGEASSSDKDGDTNLYQVFITKSPVLCSQVKKHFEKLINGHPELQKKWANPTIVPCKSLTEYYSRKDFPIFVTSRQFLLILDSTLPGDPFFDRDEKRNITVKICNSDYNQDSNPDLLFTDNVTGNSNDDGDEHKNRWMEVTADFFCKKIWPDHLKSKFGRKFEDPLLVWMEIQSFIKGSAKALESEDGYIDKADYNEIGKKMAPNFTPEERKDIYLCFKEYKKILRWGAFYDCQRLFDESDVVFNLFKRFLKQRKLPESLHIDHFYIDEVQDFTQAELSLLLRCSKHPSGTFCTGDTAQSIMKGVFFRFEDLKSQFWTLVHSKETKSNPSAVPKLKVLTDNFRAHSGILGLAQAVIKIMTGVFKKSFIDNVPDERPMFEGPKPILLDATSIKELTSILLGNAASTESQQVELGAHQAIIVRSEEAKNKLPESLKDGIVLTVLEAKGLEFNDVLLYNFFKDSEVSKEWRLFYNNCDSDDRPLNESEKSEDKLKSLLAELKYLYTAITRARVNLWVYDESVERRKPFFCFAKNLAKLIDTSSGKAVDDNLLFAAPSEKEQWSKQGDYFFRVRRWDVAVICYEKAGLKHQVNITRAYMMAEEAERLPDMSQPQYTEAALAFLAADNHYHQTDYINKAIYCLKKGGQHEILARLFEKMEKYGEAAKEWAKAGKFLEHAQVLEKMQDYSGAIRAYANGKDYETALQKAVQYEQRKIKLDSTVSAQQIASEFARVKVSEGDEESVRNIMTFISDGRIKADFLKETGLYLEAVEELLKEYRSPEAVRIMKARGMFEKGLACIREQSLQEMFKLCIAQHQIIVEKFFNDPLINELIESKEEYIKARSEFLCGKFKNDAKYFRKAMNSFAKSPGRIMSYHAMMKAQTDDRSNINMAEFLTVIEDIDCAREAACALIDGKTNRKQRAFMEDVLRLFDIDEDATCYYTTEISCKYAKYATDLELETNESDIDGMLILEKEKVHIALLAMYDQIYHTLFSLPVVQTHLKRLLHNLSTCKMQFDSHPFVLRYFDEAMMLFKFCTLFPNNDLDLEEIGTVKDTIISMFLPHSPSLLYICSSNVNISESDYLLNAAYVMIGSPDASLDDYFSAWAILMLFLHPEDVNKHLHDTFKAKERDGDGLVISYPKKKTHVFFWWTYACRQVISTQVIAGCSTMFHNLLCRFPEIQHDASISSITSIASLMTIMLVIGINSSTFSQIIKFTVPSTYENICTIFGYLNKIDVTSICSTSGLASVNFNKSIERLRGLLDHMIGYERHHNGILQMALSSEVSLNDGSARNCLALCLVLAANLYWHYSRSANTCMHPRLLLIQKELKKFRKHHGHEHPFIENACFMLQEAKSIGNIFSLIAQLSSNLVCPIAVMRKVKFMPVPPGKDYPQIKRIVTIEDSEEEEPENQFDIDTSSAAITNEVKFLSQTSTDQELDDELYKEIEEDEDKIDEIQDDMLEDGECLACGTNFSKSGSERQYNLDLKHHFEGAEHGLNVEKFKKFNEVLQEAKQLYKQLSEELSKYEIFYENQRLLKQSESKHKEVMGKVKQLEESFNWVECIQVLQGYIKSIKSWLAAIDKPRMAAQEGDEEEEAEMRLLPLEEEEKWTKSTC